MKIQTDTDMVEIKAVSRFLPDQSDLPENRYVFAYHITITNRSEQTVKLLTRHWIITDGGNHVREIHGDGVVGEQPHLNPGESYEYVSGTVLNTPQGTMRGSFQMSTDDGHTLDAEIPEFLLNSSGMLH